MISKKISVVLPVFNEETIVEKLIEEIERNVSESLEFVFINDGSSDQTLDILKQYQLRKKTNRKKIVNLSRNFGHQKALMAGLSSISKDSELVLVMDADFQDQPQDIPLLIDKLNQGYDCVYAVRTANSGSRIVNFFTSLFYKIQEKILTFSIPQHAGTFSLFNRDVLEKILEFKEFEIYFPGLRAYVGMNQTGIHVNRGTRADGESKVGKMGLINLSLTGIIGFSALPMRLIFLSGLIITLTCFLLGFAVFVMKIVGITKVMGVSTILIVVFGLFGIQIMFMGIVGEYVGKLFLETKGRPRWVVKEVIDE